MLIKSKQAIERMTQAGQLLADIFEEVASVVQAGATTESIDTWIALNLKKRGMVSQSKGYRGYKHVSCISVNDVVVHGVPSAKTILQKGDLVKVDVCAAWRNYCADMARVFVVGGLPTEEQQRLVTVAQDALNAGIQKAVPGNKLFDISSAIQKHVEQHGYGIVRDFAGHGIGRSMHEDPDVPNYGKAGTGFTLRAGMTFAIEPMITQGNYDITIDKDGWTARTEDGSLAMHVEDTILITENGPKILTRLVK